MSRLNLCSSFLVALLVAFAVHMLALPAGFKAITYTLAVAFPAGVYSLPWLRQFG